MEETEYTGECVVCFTSMRLVVRDEEEVPVYCPLCGSTMDFEQGDSDI